MKARKRGEWGRGMGMNGGGEEKGRDRKGREGMRRVYEKDELRKCFMNSYYFIHTYS